jgi:hypothetical protein
MPQSPETPVTRRLHVLRRRIAAATLATFVADHEHLEPGRRWRELRAERRFAK